MSNIKKEKPEEEKTFIAFDLGDADYYKIGTLEEIKEWSLETHSFTEVKLAVYEVIGKPKVMTLECKIVLKTEKIDHPCS